MSLPEIQKLSKKQRAQAVANALAKRYITPETHLVASNPFELLIATVLSAQCTDARVNTVTPHLFQKWPTAQKLAEANLGEVEECIRSTGFFRSKAKNIIGAAQRIVHVYGGSVPETMSDLISLPGVARKTANVVLWNAFHKNEGIAVDTHVARISKRLGLTTEKDPNNIEKDLMKLFPREEWGNINHRMVWFGRHICDARKPRCEECEMLPFCPQKGL